jgi:hypothetical protein
MVRLRTKSTEFSFSVFTTTTTTVNYIQTPHKASDLRKPGDFTHTGCTKQEVKPQIFIIVRQLRVYRCGASSLTGGRVCLQPLLALASASIIGSESRGTHDLILLSQIRDSPNLEGQVPVFITPLEQGAPAIPSGTGFPFVRLLRLAGLRWRYSNPPPRGEALPVRTPYTVSASDRKESTASNECLFWGCDIPAFIRHDTIVITLFWWFGKWVWRHFTKQTKIIIPRINSSCKFSRNPISIIPMRLNSGTLANCLLHPVVTTAASLMLRNKGLMLLWECISRRKTFIAIRYHYFGLKPHVQDS